MESPSNNIYPALDTSCRKFDYAGWDPFDALNSKIFQATPLAKSRWMRLAWLQLFKRIPINFRPIAFVPRTHNGKALALFVRSYLLQGDKESARYCLDKMLTLRSTEQQWGMAAWGYPFDWQAKAFFVAKGVPNVICTTYATLAIDAAKEAGIIDNADSYITAAADFVLEHLWRDNEQGKYIAYIPSADALVHNASLWGAFICTKAYEVSGDEKYKLAAMEAIDTSLKVQQENGAWVYGALPHHQFIDGFHTGYNLEALHRMNIILKDDRITAAIKVGMKYYLDSFFNTQGQAAYYHHNPYPLDAHSYAQAVITLSLIKPQAYEEKLNLIMQHSIDNLWNGKDAFYYQKHKAYTNKINYLRWTQSWMHLALSTVKQHSK